MLKALYDVIAEIERERFLLQQDLIELEAIEERKKARENYISTLIDRKWKIEGGRGDNDAI